MDSNQFIRLTDDYLLLDISEENVDLLNDSFSLEIYEVTTDSDQKEILTPKLFKKQIERIVDGILLDDEEIEAQISDAEVDQNFVEYYFNISLLMTELTIIPSITRLYLENIKETYSTTMSDSMMLDKFPDQNYMLDNNGDEC